jgi:hypothetical protein
LAEAVREHQDEIAEAVLARTVSEGAPGVDGFSAYHDDELGMDVWLTRTESN